MSMLLYEDYSQDQPKVNTGLITKAEDDDDESVVKYLEGNIIFSEKQHGFTRGRSCLV